jgi:predicted DNA-binding transcriptional regulator AlpA
MNDPSPACLHEEELVPTSETTAAKLDLSAGAKWRIDILYREMDLIPPETLARALGLSQSRLAQWRGQGLGPAYVKLGKRVFYRREFVAAWIEKSICKPAVAGGKPSYFGGNHAQAS